MSKKRSVNLPSLRLNVEQPGTWLRRPTVLIFVLLALGRDSASCAEGCSPGRQPCDDRLRTVIAAQIDAALAEVRPDLGPVQRGNTRHGPASDELVQAGFCFEQAERFESSDARWRISRHYSRLHNPGSHRETERAAQLRPDQPDAVRLRLAQSLSKQAGGRKPRPFQKTLKEHQPRSRVAGLAALSHAGGQLDEAADAPVLPDECAHRETRSHPLAQVERQLGHTASATRRSPAATLSWRSTLADPFTEKKPRSTA